MKSKFLPLVLIIGLIALGFTIVTLQKEQTLNTHASAESIVYFTPESSFLKPLKRKVGDRVALDIMVNPGKNKISIIKLVIEYDTELFRALGKETLVTNQALPSIVEGPLLNETNGTISVTLSVGIDPTKAITAPTKLGTITLLALKDTGTSNTKISFTTGTQAFSVASTDHAFANIIATAVPAYIALVANPFSGGPLTPTTPPQIGTPSPTKVVEPTPNLNATTLTLESYLHGIGNSGDSVNPQAHSFSNKTPQNTTRQFTLTLENTATKTVTTKKITLTYNKDSGSYKGILDLGVDFPTGKYVAKIKNDNFLQARIPGVVDIVTSSKLKMVAVTLVAGDANNDNSLNILDYNTIMECFMKNTSCKTKAKADINDDGTVNQIDYNLLIREIKAL